MSIQKYQSKTGSRYCVRLYVGKDSYGKQIYYVKRGFKSEREARIHEARKKIEFEDVGYTKPIKSSFKSIYNEWLLSYENTVQKTTYQRTVKLFKLHILPIFGNRDITKITPTECQKAINTWGANYVNVKHLKSYSSQIFEYAIFAEILKRNPMKNTKLPKREKKITDNYFSLDELKSFLNILQQEEPLKHQLIFQLLISTGMRKGELAALRWSDVDFDKQLICINKSFATLHSNSDIGYKTIRIQKSTKNASSNRILSLDMQTISMLKKWKTQQAVELLKLGINTSSDDQLIFTYVNMKGQANQPLHADYANNIMKRLEKKYNLKHVTIHGLRHTHATLLLESGVSIKEAQDRLGHQNAETTLNTYTHITKNARKNAIDKFANYVKF